MNLGTFLIVVSLGGLFSTSLPDHYRDYHPSDRCYACEDSLVEVDRDICLKEYFHWISSTLQDLTQKGCTLDEYDLIEANPWILDQLRESDYYRLKANGILIDDILSTTVLRKGQILDIPDSVKLAQIRTNRLHTYLDLNIPEYKLRIYRHNKILHDFLVRVGKNDTTYLAMVGQVVDLRTKPGKGKIVRVIHQPTFINPKDNRPYKVTKRDDNRVTSLPNIPWLEPEINGTLHGQLIHPTTNRRTLGKAASNGCIGLSEADAWTVYYHAPVGTKIIIRYDLTIRDSLGNELVLPDIYPERSQYFKKISPAKAPSNVCDCN